MDKAKEKGLAITTLCLSIESFSCVLFKRKKLKKGVEGEKITGIFTDEKLLSLRARIFILNKGTFFKDFFLF